MEEQKLIQNRYEIQAKIGEGTYGVVFQCIDQQTKQTLALKKIKIDEGEDEGVPATALREISILKHLEHKNIVTLQSIIVVKSKKNELYLSFDYHPYDLRKYMKGVQPSQLNTSFYQDLFFQLLSGIDYCHSQGILHRDLKPQNILVDINNTIKIADFGLSRAFSFPLNLQKTSDIVTLWYRAPEILLGDANYGLGVDMWSLGCIMTELVTMTPLFCGDGSQIDQIFKIFSFSGTPTLESWPKLKSYSTFKPSFPKFKANNILRKNQIFKNMIGELGINLIENLLQIDPEKRINCMEALQHPFFDSFKQEKMIDE